MLHTSFQVDIDKHTLLDAIDAVQVYGKEKGITFINGFESEWYLSYEDLLSRSLNVLGNIQSLGIKKSDELIIYLEDNQAFIIVFWACLLGGIVPVPLAVGGQDDHKLKLLKAWTTLNNPYLVSDKINIDRLIKFMDDGDFDITAASITGHSVAMNELQKENGPGIRANVDSNDLAYLQFSSGSTGAPKGVMLSHKNLMANTRDIAIRSKITKNDRSLSWMPLTHDMGLICFHLTSILSGIDQFLLPTSLFIRRPTLWIEKSNQHVATLLYSPNFGYRYFLNALGENKFKWNLENVKLVYNGAEPISAELCTEFTKVMNIYGLKANVMFPGYGLAEASVAVTLPDVGQSLTTYYLDRNYLNVGCNIQEIDIESSRAVSFVENGYPINLCHVRVVSNTGKVLDNRVIGNIQVKGENVTEGYYNNQAANKDLKTGDGWLRTGDLGFLNNGKLTITGRAKNIIVQNGLNYYPQDIERAAMKVAGVSLGSIVACGVQDPPGTVDKLFLFIIHKGSAKDFIGLSNNIKKSVLEGTSLSVDKFVPVRKIPKTTSGKIKVFKLREQYFAGEYDKILEEIVQINLRQKVDYRESNSILKVLKRSWEDITGESISPRDNLLQRGLNSLMAIRFVNSISERLCIELTVKDLFERPSIQELQDYISGKEISIVHDILQTNHPRPPLSANQKHFWMFNQYFHRRSTDHLGISIEFAGRLNLKLLNRSIELLIQRHEILRTRFKVFKDEPYQFIVPTPKATFDLGYIDLTRKHNSTLELDHIINNLCNKSFNLCDDTLFRVVIVRTSNHHFRMFMVFHHIICDGWSIGVLYKDLLYFYQRLEAGLFTELLPLPIQYKDYAIWEQDQLVKGAWEADLHYWKEQLKGVQRFEFPTVKKRPLVQTYNPGYVFHSFPRELLTALERFTTDQPGTMYMSIACILIVLFHRYTGQNDIAIGTTTTGRTKNVLADQIGCYINTLVLRNQVYDDRTLGEVYKEVKKTLLEAYDHQDVPFDTIINELNVPRDESRNPVFGVLLVFQEFEYLNGNIVVNDNLNASVKELPVPGAMVDLHLEFLYNQKQLDLRVNFNTDIYDNEQVSQFIHHFENAIRFIKGGYDQQLSSFEILPGTELETIKKFSEGDQVPRSHSSVLELFDHTVNNYPGVIALSSGDRVVSYSELNDKSDRLAHYLIEKLSVEVEDQIAIVPGRNEDFVIGMLAVMKSGAAFVPIDPGYPNNRKALLLQSTQLKAIIRSKNVTIPTNIKAEVITLTGLDEFKIPNSRKRPCPTSNQLAYLLYTSGSTGKPKGVMIEHRSLVDYVETFISYFSIDPVDVVIHQSSPSFDTAIEEIFPILCSGGRLVIAENGGSDVDALRDLVINENVSVLSTTPLVINELNKISNDFIGLRALISGGDRLYSSYIDQLINNVQIYNTYGPTEATVCVSFCKVDDLASCEAIGFPNPNHTLHLLSYRQEPVPIGVVGELYIGGIGVARGYSNNDKENRQRFVTSPFNEHEILFRTGDMAKWLPSGKILFDGRNDQQVKVNGYRIELGEIEAILLAHNSIDKAVVLFSETCGLCAFVEGVEDSEIYTYTRTNLPPHMIPSSIQWLDSMPITPSGKLDKKQLIALINNQQRELLEPANEIEERVLQIWKDVLEIEKIFVNDNFFQLGGNSIHGVKVVHRAQQILGVSIDLRHVFQYPTIESLSNYLKHAQKKHVQAIPTLPRREKYALSNSQKRLWILSQFDKENSPYHISAAYQIAGELSKNRLEKAFLELICRHEILRTNFIVRDGIPYQKVNEQSNFNIDWINLAKEPNPSFQIQSILKDSQVRPFDLESDCLLRVIVAFLGQERYILILTIHHIISDAWSLEIMLKELAQTYEGRQGSVRFNTLDIQYKEYATWSNNRIAARELESARKYLVDKLSAPLPVLNLPADKSRPTIQTYNGEVIRTEFGTLLTQQLLDYCADKDISPFHILLTAVYIVFHRYTQDTDIILGIPVNGRDHYQLQDQLGFYVNSIPFRVNIDPSDSFDELLALISRSFLEAYEHQEYPFDLLVDEIPIERDLGRTPVFDVMVGFRDVRETDLIDRYFTSFQVEPLELEITTSQFDVSLDFKLADENLKLDLEYNTDIFHASRIKNLGGHIIELLDKALKNGTTPVCTLKYLKEEESKQLLLEFNPSPFEFNNIDYVHSSFEFYAKTKAGTITLQFLDKSFSYHFLNEKANQLSHYLVDFHQIKTGDIVALHLEKSEWNVICVLAILKAGAVFLPLDPNLPADRVEDILQDVKPRIVITGRKELILTPGIDILDLFRIIKEITEFASNDNPITFDSNRLAYIIYTSGSTGSPKGVMISHGNLSSALYSMVEAYSIDSMDVCLLQLASFGFDVFIGDLLKSICSGGKMIVCPGGSKFDPQALSQILQNEYVNTFESTPALIIPIMEYAIEHTVKLPGLRLVIVGSDTCSKENFTKINDWVGDDCLVYNSYGTTETTIDSSIYSLDHDDKSTSTPVGKPIANTSYFILDSNQQLVPKGVIGELYIGGAAVGQGYIGQDELTKSKFVSIPSIYGSTLYKTGDMARWLWNGNVELIGRNDKQVKIRGFRVELEDIERVLLQHPLIHAVVVHPVVSSEEDTFIGAWYKADETLDDEIRRFLEQKLPYYMIPSYCTKIDEWPVTSNGKINYAELNKMIRVTNDRLEVIDPQNILEKKVLCIFKKVLKNDQVGVTHNFFQYGGNSIKAMQAIHQIRKELKTGLDLKFMFSHPSVRSIVVALPNTVTVNHFSVNQSQEVDHHPLSSGQKRLWILSQSGNPGASYHMPASFNISGEINVEALNYAFQKIVERHEVLSTTIKVISGEPRQVVSNKRFELEYTDILLENSHSLQELEKIVFNNPFDLSKDCLIKAHLVKKEERSFVLLICIHHIAADGWSIQVISDELKHFYESYLAQRKPSLNALSFHYKDFSLSQHDWLQQLWNPSKEYWANKLKDPLHLLELPTDLPRPSRKTYHGATLTFELGNTVDGLSYKKGTTPFTVLLAGVGVLLGRYSGQYNFVIGTVVSGRSFPGSYEQVGFYANTLPFLVSLDLDNTLNDFLELTKDQLISNQEHELFPFDEMLAVTGLKWDRSRSPMFDVIVSFQSSEFNTSSFQKLGSASISENTVEVESSKFDITFNFVEKSNGEIQLQVEYNTDLYMEETIFRMSRNLNFILERFFCDTHILLHELESLDPLEIHEIKAFNRAIADIKPGTSSIIDLFEKQVQQSPGAIAVSCDDTSLSYSELNNLSNGFAQRLRRHYHVNKNDVVGVMMERSELMVVVIYGILKAGSSYLPIDPGHPTDRKIYMLGQSQSKLVVSSQEFGFPFLDIEILDYRVIFSALVGKKFKFRSNVDSKQQLAYTIYTSGTTGRPKGVMVEHGAVLNLVSWLGELIYPHEERVFDALLTASISFDASVQLLFGPLVYGGSLRILPNEYGKDPIRYVETIIQNDVKIIDITPSFLSVVLTIVDSLNTYIPIAHTLTGGETLPVSLIRQYYKLLPSSSLVNVYGVTEATVNSTFEVIDPGGPIVDAVIGKPIKNTLIIVLDGELNIVPIGAWGELYIGGLGVARGYVGDPEQTSQKFQKIDNEIYYKTGDRVRWLVDGRLQFGGRLDNQVKLNGYRIELDEVIHVLNAFPGIQNCSVLVHDNSLVAYYDGKVPVGDLKSFLGKMLPKYMIPRLWYQLDELPLSINGKVNTQDLPKPQITPNSSKPLIGDLQNSLGIIWKSILALEEIGAEDNFFELGGDSLKLLRLITESYRKLKVQLTFQDIYEHPTISALADVIEGKERQEETTNISLVEEQEYYPLTSSQKGIWLGEQLNKNQKLYKLTGSYELSGNFGQKLLLQSLEHVVKKHESLRTAIVEIEDEPYQVILPYSKNYVECVSISSHDSLNEIMQNEYSKEFDLTQSLFRVLLVNVDRNKSILIYSIHHLISDAVSSGVFTYDLFGAYNTLAENKVLTVSNSYQYKDSVNWLVHQQNGPKWSKHRSYWLNKLKNLPQPITLSSNGPWNERVVSDSSIIPLDKELSKSLDNLTRETQSTKFMIFLASVYALLYRYTGQRDMVVGTPMDGRVLPVMADQIGLFVNTVPLRVTFPNGKITFLKFLEKVKAMVIEGLDHQLFSLNYILDELNLSSNGKRIPLFDIFVAAAEKPVNFPKARDIKINVLPVDKEEAKFSMVLTLVSTAQSLSIDISYHRSIFSTEFISLFGFRLKELLHYVSQEPGLMLDSIPIKLGGTYLATSTQDVEMDKLFDFEF